MTCFTGEEVLLPDCVSPLYVAVKDRVPAGRYLLVKAAVLPLSDTVPIDEVPFLNVTVPVGATEPFDVTVAESVTACP